MMSEITTLTSVAEIVKQCPTARRVFDRYGLKGCGGEHGPTEPLAFFAAVHKVDVGKLVEELNAEMRLPATETYVYQEWHTMNLSKTHRAKLLQTPLPLPAR